MPITERIYRNDYSPRKAGTSLMDYYGNLLQKNKFHSPQASTVSLVSRMHDSMEGIAAQDTILDLGSARQFFERAYVMKHGKLPCNVLTLDFAPIKRHLLLANNSPKVNHARGDGNRLPLKDESISAIVSNMALDFMKEDAIAEMHRVLKPGGRAHINLSYLALDLKNVPQLDEMIRDTRISPSRRKELVFWREYLIENKPLITNPEQARELFAKNGFIVKRVEEVPDPKDIYDWCEIDVVKSKYPDVNSTMLPSDTGTISNSTVQETKPLVQKGPTFLTKNVPLYLT